MLCDCVFSFACRSGGLGGKGALQQTIQEKLSPSHADAGEPDEDCERRAGGHTGPPSGAEERLAPLAAESRRAQSCDGEAGSRAQVSPLPGGCFDFNQGFGLFEPQGTN